ncbi:MAG TPA: type II 3-dehydroquinate dehydratase [Candidatus Magasanikbacteria bacterium]|nr:MAG: type II 3-dehydroquinate dehydratase [Candidatus Magasanikbacteria bacterium RIFOXYC2_FULL_39_8]HAT03465.1 type II 3-dehydroquinate dehydratase [Candidatus Magasanikbacteria bacterium]
MKKILLIHGPNLNLLGKRDKNHYGDLTLKNIEDLVTGEATKYEIEIETFQSNHEGTLIDWIQQHSEKANGIIINPGALTHYSYALHDALFDTELPCVEVHLSDVENREEWRKISVTAPACIAKISGKKELGYIEGLKLLIKA